MSLSSIMQQASIGQDYNTQETRVGTVTRVYTDSNGNVTGADVRLPGQTRSVIEVPNSSGIRLSVGSQANVNFNRGQRHSYNIIAAGNTQTATTAAADAATLASASGLPVSSSDLSNAPVLLQSSSESVPNGYVATAGANVTLTSIAPVISASGTETSAGEFNIAVDIPQYTVLPNPFTTLLPDGSLAFLVNSYGVILGFYELSLSLREWQLIGISGGGGGGGSTESTPVYALSMLWDTISRVPVDSDFTGAGVINSAYYAAGSDGSLLFQTPGYDVACKFDLGLTNTTGSSVTVTWNMPGVDNYASASWNGTLLASWSGVTTMQSGTFSIAAGQSAILELMFCNNTSGSDYDPTNPGAFWFITDALSISGVEWYALGSGGLGGVGITALTGDVTASGTGSVVATLATVNTNVGTFGSASQVATPTVNAKGLITGIVNTAISITSSAVSNFTSAVNSLIAAASIALTQLSQGGASTGQVLEWNGTAWVPTTPSSASGTVTSVGLSLPSIFSVSGSPVTTTGTLTATLATETANTALLGPASGSAAAPTFRSLVVADVPGLPSAPRIVSITSSSTPTINVGTTDQYKITALAVGATIGITGTPADGQKLMVRILDNGTAQTITWSSAFASSGAATLLSTTVAGKTHMVGLIYDTNKAQFLCMACDSVGY